MGHQNPECREVDNLETWLIEEKDGELKMARQMLVADWIANQKWMTRFGIYTKIVETDKAIRVKRGEREFWLPKSQITLCEKREKTDSKFKDIAEQIKNKK
jgi:hypothetical protein